MKVKILSKLTPGSVSIDLTEENRLEQLYYPYGREEEVIDIDNDDHIITADDRSYMHLKIIKF